MESPVGTILYSATLGNAIFSNISIENSYAISGGAFNLVSYSNLTLTNVTTRNCSCLK